MKNCLIQKLYGFGGSKIWCINLCVEGLRNFQIRFYSFLIGPYICFVASRKNIKFYVEKVLILDLTMKEIFHDIIIIIITVLLQTMIVNNNHDIYYNITIDIYYNYYYCFYSNIHTIHV